MISFQNSGILYIMAALSACLVLTAPGRTDIYVEPYLSFTDNDDPASTMVISWIADEEEVWTVTVEGPNNYHRFQMPLPDEYNDYYYYHAEFDSLEYGEIYTYTVVLGLDEYENDFRAGINELNEGDVFIIYGDTHNGDIHSRVAEGFMEDEPLFIFHVGDLADGPTLDLLIEDFFDPIIEQDVITTRPLLACLGNHDCVKDNTSNYEITFEFPRSSDINQTELYYSFDYGQLHVISLNSEWDIEPGTDQYAWLEADLASTDREFRLVIFHRPPYSLGGSVGGDNSLTYLYWCPLLERYHVQAVFCGHEHSYNHNIQNGIHYVVTGGAANTDEDDYIRLTYRTDVDPGYLFIERLELGTTGFTVEDEFEIYPYYPPQALSGDLSAIGTLEKENYTVVGNIWIEEGETLIIESGTQLFFEEGTGFIVQGRLIADGINEDGAIDSIKFIPPPGSNGEWSGIHFDDANPLSSMSYCLLSGSDNSGITLSGSDLNIANCTISGNSTQESGGGICCQGDSEPAIRQCVINGNSADTEGGGIYIEDSSPSIETCLIFYNSAQNQGGCIYIYHSNPNIQNCTIVENTADQGGGIHCALYSSATLLNCIIWDNDPEQITYEFGCDPVVTYSDVMGGYSGTGNINANPEFVNSNLHDYRLKYDESPCIDTGDPSSPLDPDSSNADMGTLYFDHRLPRLSITRLSPPVLRVGENLEYEYTVENIWGFPQEWDIWSEFYREDCYFYPTFPEIPPIHLGQVVLPSVLWEGNADHTLQPGSPGGYHLCIAKAGVWHDNILQRTVDDSAYFVFVKINPHEGYDLFTNGAVSQRAAIPAEFVLKPPYPNPFNSFTTFNLALPKASHVELSVYNIAGCMVERVVDGWRNAGYHDATFNGTGLASGVYIYRIEAGNFSTLGKVVLLK